jgi:hypothetical protein
MPFTLIMVGHLREKGDSEKKKNELVCFWCVELTECVSEKKRNQAKLLNCSKVTIVQVMDSNS